MRLNRWLVFCSLFGATTVAFASTTTGSLNAVTEVMSMCEMTGGNINFGNYDPLVENKSSPLDAVGTFTIACTKGTSATLSLDGGQYSAHANGTTRAMSSGGAYLSYDLYTSAARSTVWSLVNTVSYLSTSKATSTSQSVWGRIPAGQNVPGGVVYNDIVTVTANF